MANGLRVQPKTWRAAASPLSGIRTLKVSHDLAIMKTPITVAQARILMKGSKFGDRWTGWPNGYIDGKSQISGQHFLGHMDQDDAQIVAGKMARATGRSFRLPTFDEARKFLEPRLTAIGQREREIELISTSDVHTHKYHGVSPGGGMRPPVESYETATYYHRYSSDRWQIHEPSEDCVVWLVEDLKAKAA